VRNDIFGLAKQTGLGTKQTVMEYFPPVETVSPGASRETLEEEETTGTRFPTGIEYGTQFWEVQVEGAARFNSLPRLLSGFLCAPVTTTPDGTGAPTGRNHAFDVAAPGAAPVPHSMFVVRRDPSPPIVDLFWDALGNELELSVEPNGFVRYAAGYVARELDDGQPAPSPTLDVSKRIPFDLCKAHLSVDDGPETEVAVAGFSLAYSNSIDTDEAVLGSRRLFTVEPGNATAEVTFMPRQGLEEHYRRALQDDPASVRIRLEALGAVIGAAVRYKLEVIVHSCEYVDAPAEINAAERLKSIEVTARARYDDTSSKFVTVNVVNEINAY
jgi:hypothetical protein